MIENKFEKLDVWKKAHELVLYVYKISSKFPSSERFSLTDQLRRASVSVPANVAEGNIRQSNKEFLQFLFIAKSSLEEVKYYLFLAKDLKYITEIEYQKSFRISIECGKLISGFIKYLRSKV